MVPDITRNTAGVPLLLRRLPRPTVERRGVPERTMAHGLPAAIPDRVRRAAARPRRPQPDAAGGGSRADGRGGLTGAQFPGEADKSSPTQIAAAARRFESLSPADQRAWLATHLATLRAGTLSLAQIP